MQNRISWVLEMSGHVLRVIHEHTSAPIGFEDSKAILKREGKARACKIECRLTLPSSGPVPAGFAVFHGPLKSNVRAHRRRVRTTHP